MSDPPSNKRVLSSQRICIDLMYKNEPDWTSPIGIPSPGRKTLSLVVWMFSKTPFFFSMPCIDPASFRTSALRSTLPVAPPQSYSTIERNSYTIQSYIFIIYITWRWENSYPLKQGTGILFCDYFVALFHLLFNLDLFFILDLNRLNHRNDNRSTAYQGCERNGLSIGF